MKYFVAPNGAYLNNARVHWFHSGMVTLQIAKASWINSSFFQKTGLSSLGVNLRNKDVITEQLFCFAILLTSLQILFTQNRFLEPQSDSVVVNVEACDADASLDKK